MTHIVPTDSGLRSSIAPLPSRVVTTGACRSSATAVSSALASSPSTTPPPAKISGRSAAASSAAARRHRVGIRGLARRRARRRASSHRRGLGERLGRHLDLDRSGPAASQPGERLVHRAGDLVGLERALLPLGDRADEVELVVRPRAAARDAWPMPWRFTWPAMSSTGDDAAYAVARPAPALYTPTPGTTNATPGRPPRARVAVGHVGGGLLVARGDEADRRLVVEPVERVHELVARQTEDVLHALAHELARERLPAGHLLRHGHVLTGMIAYSINRGLAPSG